jgi:hypothetical protein
LGRRIEPLIQSLICVSLHRCGRCTLEKSSKLAENQIPWPLAELGHAYARMSNTSQADRVLADLDRWSKRNYVPPYLYAVVYAGLGKKDQAFA